MNEKPPQRGTVAVIGTGMIGTAIALASRAAGYRVAGWDPDSAAVEIAWNRGALDRRETNLESTVFQADLVVVAAPPAQVPVTVRAVLGATTQSTAVTDVTSVKKPLESLALADARYVPGHPMAGGERHGPEHADPSLFAGAAWPLCPVASTQPAMFERVRRWVSDMGALPMPMDPERHDAAIALTSHLPHLLAYALFAQAVRRDSVDGLPVFALAAGGFHSSTRVAASDPDVWTDIVCSNRSAVAEELDALIQALRAVSEALRVDDETAVRERLRAGARRFESTSPECSKETRFQRILPKSIP